MVFKGFPQTSDAEYRLLSCIRFRLLIVRITQRTRLLICFILPLKKGRLGFLLGLLYDKRLAVFLVDIPLPVIIIFLVLITRRIKLLRSRLLTAMPLTAMPLAPGPLLLRALPILHIFFWFLHILIYQVRYL